MINPNTVFSANHLPKTEEEIDLYVRQKDKMLCSIAHKYEGTRFEFEDLLQEARLGFLRGVRNFNPNNQGKRGKPASLDTFCHTCAENQVKMMLRANSAQKRGGREIYTVSLDASPNANGEDRGSSLESLIEDFGTSEGAEEVMKSDILTRVMKLAHECLNETELNMLLLYYNGSTQNDIAAQFDVAQSTACRCIRLSHAKLRWYLEQNGYKSFADVSPN